MSFFKRIFGKRKEEAKEKKLPEKDKRSSVRVVHIENFSAPNKIKKGDVLKIVVSGNFPNLAWTLDKAYATIKQKTIILTVLGKVKLGMMGAQALKPYNTVIEIKDLKKGTYKIKTEKGTTQEMVLNVY